MREIVIISGKGGTGKTSITGTLSLIAGTKAVMADCDVDASDLHLILQPQIISRKDFFSGVIAEIDTQKCLSCGLCKKVCHFDAVEYADSKYQINEMSCEGCGYCFLVCPAKAISLNESKVGETYNAISRAGSDMVYAKLDIAADNSGKLVSEVKKMAKAKAEENNKEYIIVDGSPGIGCPVISSLSGADFVLLVTEPTLSGLSDLKRVWDLVNKFKIPAGCIINKADINPDLTQKIKLFLETEKIDYISSIPYDSDFQKAIANAMSIVEYNPEKWTGIFENIWEKIHK